MHAHVSFVNREFLLARKARQLPQPWPPEESFWDRLQRLRNALGVENAEIARAADTAVGTVSNWRQGRTPETGAVLRLAQYFGVSVEWLLTGRAAEGSSRSGLPIEEDADQSTAITPRKRNQTGSQ